MMQGPGGLRGSARRSTRNSATELGGFAQHMLIGFTPEEAAKADLYTRLVNLLSPSRNRSACASWPSTRSSG